MERKTVRDAAKIAAEIHVSGADVRADSDLAVRVLRFEPALRTVRAIAGQSEESAAFLALVRLVVIRVRHGIHSGCDAAAAGTAFLARLRSERHERGRVVLAHVSAPQVQFAHRADLIRLDDRSDGRMRKVGGGPVVSGEFDAITGESLRSADDVGLIIRTDAHPVPARAGLESAGQQVAFAFTVEVDGLVMSRIPHPQRAAVELHSRVRGLGALEDGARKDVAFELACRHLVGRDSASRDLDGRHTVCRELVGGDGTSDNLGRIDRISSQFIRVHRASRQGSSGHGISRNLSGLDLVDVEQRHGHVFRDLELRRRDRVGCNLVGRDGQCDDIPRLHRISRQFASGHRIGNQLLGRDRVCRQLVRRDGIGLDLLRRH